MEQWRISLAAPYDLGYGYGVRFGGRKARKEDPPNCECELVCSDIIFQSLDRFIVNNTLLYLPWNSFPDNSTRDIGTIAFVLISSNDDVLIPNSAGLEEPVNQTLVITVSSWIANDPLSES